MLGKNTKLPYENIENGSILKINDIFATFQGEGPYVGRYSIFVRLSGCNLSCEFCDTEFESYYKESIDNLIKKIYQLHERNKMTCIMEATQYKENNNENNYLNMNNQSLPLIVITGGEPFRQNIVPFCNLLVNNNFEVQIETNGTMFQNINKNVKLVCSPKSSNGKYHQIRKDILEMCIAIKFLVSCNISGYRDLPDITNYKNIPIYIQPIDELDEEKNLANMKLAMNLTVKYNGVLSVQMHKILSIK